MSSWKNYGPLFVFVPALAAIHWGWFALQQRMVPPDQQVKEQPIVSVSKSAIFIRSKCISHLIFVYQKPFLSYLKAVKKFYARAQQKWAGSNDGTGNS